jgi:hypothetical protein
MINLRTALAATACAGLLSACATTVAIPPASATLEYAGVACSRSPDLSTAISLTPDKERAVFSVNAPTGSGCLTRADGGTTPYLTFALPADHADKTVIVGSILEPLRILSPSVAILDRNGAVTRTFNAEDYMYRGSVFSVQFRPRETEGYVLVTADPVRVGQRYDSIVVGVNTTTVYTGYGTSQWRSGTEMAQSRMFSWEGLVQVSVADSDTKEEAQAQ